MSTLEEQKVKVRIFRRRIRLYSDILRSLNGIVNCLILDNKKADFIKNNIRSIAFNLFELFHSERPQSFD